MHGIAPELPFTPLRIAALVISDTRTEETDTSGALLVRLIEEAGHAVAGRRIVPDDVAAIRGAVAAWIADPDVDVVVSSGGTGLTARDVTPEAVLPLLEKVMDGFSVVFHMASLDSVGSSTMQSRAFAGIANGTAVFCLPGSNGAVRDGWTKAIATQLDSRHRPCNLVEILPRTRAR